MISILDEVDVTQYTVSTISLLLLPPFPAITPPLSNESAFQIQWVEDHDAISPELSPLELEPTLDQLELRFF